MRISDWSSDVCSSDLLLVDAPRQSETELHALLHRELTLSDEQEARLQAIEAQFAGRREALEIAMRAANIRLARAIEAEHDRHRVVSGTRVAEAVVLMGRALL